MLFSDFLICQKIILYNFFEINKFNQGPIKAAHLAATFLFSPLRVISLPFCFVWTFMMLTFLKSPASYLVNWLNFGFVLFSFLVRFKSDLFLATIIKKKKKSKLGHVSWKRVMSVKGSQCVGILDEGHSCSPSAAPHRG